MAGDARRGAAVLHAEHRAAAARQVVEVAVVPHFQIHGRADARGEVHRRWQHRIGEHLSGVESPDPSRTVVREEVGAGVGRGKRGRRRIVEGAAGDGALGVDRTRVGVAGARERGVGCRIEVALGRRPAVVGAGDAGIHFLPLTAAHVVDEHRG